MFLKDVGARPIIGRGDGHLTRRTEDVNESSVWSQSAPPSAHWRLAPAATDFDDARVVILRCRWNREQHHMWPEQRNGPHEILVASSHLELWDEETATDVHSIGICTLPQMGLGLQRWTR